MRHIHEQINHIKGTDTAGIGRLLSAGFFDLEVDQDQGDAFQHLFFKRLIMHFFQRAVFQSQECPRCLQGFSK